MATFFIPTSLSLRRNHVIGSPVAKSKANVKGSPLCIEIFQVSQFISSCHYEFVLTVTAFQFAKAERNIDSSSRMIFNYPLQRCSFWPT